MLLSEKAYKQIDIELAKYPISQRRSAIMSALRIAQVEQGWISNEVITDIAQYIDCQPIEVQEVATFYNMYNLKPVGRYKLTVCTNLPCALRDGEKTVDYISEKLGVAIGETTEDGLITLQEGECQGACGDAPVMLINNHHMCVRMSKQKIDELIGDIYNEAKAS